MGGDLSKRIWFTLGALLVYRLGTHIPIPGLEPGGHLFPCSIPGIYYIYCSPGPFGLPRVFDALTGSGFGRISIFAFSVLPYLAASALMLIATTASPAIAALEKGDEVGRKRLHQYVRYLTILLSALQAYLLAVVLEQYIPGNARFSLVRDPGVVFRLTTVLTLSAGTLFVTWLADQISRRGIGCGIGLILFSGLAVSLPSDVGTLLELGRTGALGAGNIIGLLVMAVAVIAFIVFMERAQRRVIVQYAKRQVGPKMFGGESFHLPLKLNSAGVIPPIFASSLLLMPLTVAGFSGGGGPDWLTQITALLGHGQPLYLVIYVAMIVFFCFFCASYAVDPKTIAENLKTTGLSIVGVRPGAETARHLRHIQSRLALLAAVYLAAVCLLPDLLIAQYGAAVYFGGANLLITVWVILHLVGQIHVRLQPPPGGPPDDFSGAVGARIAPGQRTSAIGAVRRQDSCKSVAAESD